MNARREMRYSRVAMKLQKERKGEKKRKKEIKEFHDREYRMFLAFVIITATDSIFRGRATEYNAPSRRRWEPAARENDALSRPQPHYSRGG